MSPSPPRRRSSHRCRGSIGWSRSAAKGEGSGECTGPLSVTLDPPGDQYEDYGSGTGEPLFKGTASVLVESVEVFINGEHYGNASVSGGVWELLGFIYDDDPTDSDSPFDVKQVVVVASGGNCEPAIASGSFTITNLDPTVRIIVPQGDVPFSALS